MQVFHETLQTQLWAKHPGPLVNYGIAIAELCEEGSRVACMSHVGAGRIVDPEFEPFLA